MKYKIAIGIFSVLLAVSCGRQDPLSKLNEEQRNFLLGDDESRIVFLGSPQSGAGLSCNPNVMNQGYTIEKTDNDLLLKSIRPSGTEAHTVKDIEVSGDNIAIKARNGANIPFNLIFSDTNIDGAVISFDGEGKAEFKRCIK